MFPGRSEIDQIEKIFRTIGKPTDRDWKGWTELKYAKAYAGHDFGRPRTIRGLFPTDFRPHEPVLNLLESMLRLDPNQRISAKDASGSKCFYSGKFPKCTCCQGYHTSFPLPRTDFGRAGAFESDAQSKWQRRSRMRQRSGSFSRSSSGNIPPPPMVAAIAAHTAARAARQTAERAAAIAEAPPPAAQGFRAGGAAAAAASGVVVSGNNSSSCSSSVEGVGRSVVMSGSGRGRGRGRGRGLRGGRERGLRERGMRRRQCAPDADPAAAVASSSSSSSS